MKTRLFHFLLLPALLFVLVRAGGPVAAQGGGPPAFTPASIRFDDLVYTVTVQGDRAYVGMDSGMAILDVKHPTAPRTMGQVQAPALGIAVNGDYAYAITSFEFEVVDVRNPYLPVKVAEKNFETVGSQYDVAVYGHYVYIGHSNGLAAIDVSDPYSPTLVGNLRWTLGEVRSVDVMKDPSGQSERIFAYLATNEAPAPGGGLIGGGLRIVDVTDPTDMQEEVYSCSTDQRCPNNFDVFDAAMRSQYAYVVNAGNYSESWQGLYIYDVADLERVREMAFYHTDDPAWYVTTLTDHSFISVGRYDQNGAMLTLDVADKATPRTRGRRALESSGLQARLTAANACVYVAEGAKGLTILCDTTITPTPPPLVWLPLWITPAG